MDGGNGGMYIADTTIESIVSAADGFGPRDGRLVLILLAERKLPSLPKLIAALNKKKISFMGGVFPGVIHDDRKYDEGAVLLSLPSDRPPLTVPGLEQDTIRMPEGAGQPPERGGLTAIVFVDGFSRGIGTFLGELFNHFGNAVHYLGGGAGFTDLVQKPCVFNADGVFQDAAIVGFVRSASALGVRHGWERLAGPVVATKTRRNVIVHLNWRNAFDVYREVVEPASGKKVSHDRFYEVSDKYPFGIMKEGQEDIVRDPFAVTRAGEIVCIGDIPENAVLNILKSRHASLIGAAGQAAKDCVGRAPATASTALVFDCVSRSYLMKEEFATELDTVNRSFQSAERRVMLEGVLSMGEICSYGEGFLDYFNKTIVLGMLFNG